MTNTAKKVSPAKPATTPKVLTEVHLIPIDRIKVEHQVRTVFNDESIAELAEDIKRRGLRSPVEVTPIGDGLYQLTLGERRIRAFKLLKQKAIPAIIVKTGENDRLVDQLAENIQREDLELPDQVKAIRQIYDKLGNLDDVVAMVKKSKPWVSKRLALSHEELGSNERWLMEQGYTEDIEILLATKYLYKNNYSEYQKLLSQLKAGKATRDTARKMVAASKEAKKKVEADRKKQKAAPATPAKPAKPEPLFPGNSTAGKCLAILAHRVLYANEGDDILAIANQMSETQRMKAEQLLEVAWKKLQPSNRTTAVATVTELHNLLCEPGETCYLEDMATLMGAIGEKFELYPMLTILHGLNQ